MKHRREKRIGQPFTYLDDKFIIDHYETMSYTMIAEVLGRTYEGIYNRARRLGLSKASLKRVRKVNECKDIFAKDSSLCWKCANSVPNTEGRGCSWSIRYEPVDGWVAENKPVKVSISSKQVLIESYCVKQCPEFIEG